MHYFDVIFLTEVISPIRRKILDFDTYVKQTLLTRGIWEGNRS